MKFTTVFAVLATLATAVSASTQLLDTNAKRFASGLSVPLPPVRRGKGSPTYGGPKGQPSGISSSCNSGPVQCCSSVTNANGKVRSIIQELVGLIVAEDVAVAFTCTPLGVLGLGGTTCKSQVVCCENNSYNGLVAIGCSPININLV